jgi:hypothetical protein
MTIDAALAQAAQAALKIVMFGLVALIGVSIPVRTVDHQTIAYLAGAYWLIRKAG